jgi:predicted aspartyl protease
VIVGTVTERGVPTISITVGGARYDAVIDTGFNGDLELPEALRAHVDPQPLAQSLSLLAGGITIVEDLFLVDFPFDGHSMEAEASFVESDEILIGTKLLCEYRLEVNFVNKTVSIERARPVTQSP